MSDTNGFESVLGNQLLIKGNIASDANIRVDGTAKGDAEVGGILFVSETGKIEGNVRSVEVKISGVVKGDIDAKKVHVTGSGRVYGNIMTLNFSAESGAYIDGKVVMPDPDAGKNAESVGYKKYPQEIVDEVVSS